MNLLRKIRDKNREIKKKHYKKFRIVLVSLFIIALVMSFVPNEVYAGFLGLPSLLDLADGAVKTYNGVFGTQATLPSDWIFGEVKDFFMKPIVSFMQTYINDAARSVSEATVSIFSVESPFNNASGINAFNTVKKLFNRFAALAIILVVISVLFGLKIGESEEKVKKLLADIVIAAFAVNIFPIILTRVMNVSNSFTKEFLFFGTKTSIEQGVEGAKNIIADSLLTVFTGGFLGPSNSMTAVTSPFLLILILLIIMAFIFIYMMSINLGQLLFLIVTLYPIAAALYPTDFGKKLMTKAHNLIGFILTVGPIQALSLYFALHRMGNIEGLGGFIKSCSFLFFTAFAVPAFVLYLYSMAQQPKV